MTGEAFGRFGRYELLGRIAVGGMAEVFLARELGEHGVKRQVAIKRILSNVADDERFVAMFRDEARLAMQLTHPNICHIYDFGMVEGHYYLSMEWVHGVPLGKLVRTARATGGLPIPIAARVLADVASALHSAHHARDHSGQELRLVHRDVSPQNIMVAYDGVVKLLDFGVAKATTQSVHTRVGSVKGKFSYMSPEQCVGSAFDSRSDIFSLGVCLYEAVTGAALYQRGNELATMTAIVEEPVPSLMSVMRAPEALDAIVRRALAKRPSDRFQTAGEMQLALEELLAREGFVVNQLRVARFLDTVIPPTERDPLGSTPFGAPIKRKPVSGSGEIGGWVGEAARPLTPGPMSTPSPGPSPSWAPKVPARRPMPEEGIDVVIDDEELAPRRSRLPWIVAALVLVAGAAGAFGAFYLKWGDDGPSRPVVEQLVPPEPAEPMPPSDPVVPELSTGSPAAPEQRPAETPEPQPVEANTGSVAAEPAGAGILVVRSTPSGATVRIDDQETPEQTPSVLEDIPAGPHRVTLRRNGYEDWTGEVDVQAGRTATLRAELQRRAVTAVTGATGTLSLTTQPAVRAYAGSRYLGRTPLRAVAVPAGTLRLRLVADGGQSYMRAVRVSQGQHARAFFTLE